jgi:hypothetical protein
VLTENEAARLADQFTLIIIFNQVITPTFRAVANIPNTVFGNAHLASGNTYLVFRSAHFSTSPIHALG